MFCKKEFKLNLTDHILDVGIVRSILDVHRMHGIPKELSRFPSVSVSPSSSISFQLPLKPISCFHLSRASE